MKFSEQKSVVIDKHKLLDSWIACSDKVFNSDVPIEGALVVLKPQILGTAGFSSGKRIFKIAAIGAGLELVPILDESGAFETTIGYIKNRTILLSALAYIEGTREDKIALCASFIDEAYAYRARLFAVSKPQKASDFNKDTVKELLANTVAKKLVGEGSKDNFYKQTSRFRRTSNSDHMTDAFRYLDKIEANFKPQKEEKTMLSQVIDRNKTAAKVAGTQIATRKVTEVLVDKVAVMLPAEALPMLKSPLGALLVANLAGVALAMAENNMEHNTRAAATVVTEAMAVNAMTDVMTAFDLPGLISGILQIPEVKSVIDAETEVSIEDYPGVS